MFYFNYLVSLALLSPKNCNPTITDLNIIYIVLLDYNFMVFPFAVTTCHRCF